MLRKVLAAIKKDHQERGIPIIAQIVTFPLFGLIVGLAIISIFPLLFWYVMYMAIVAAPFFIYYVLILPVAKRLRSYNERQERR
jgi:hypothetical protein